MYTQIAANKRRTWVLMAGFVGFIVLLGYLFGLVTARPGLVVFFAVFAIIYALVGYFVSASLTLALAGAKPVARTEAPELYRAVENLAIAAGLPMPRVYLINDPSPNAFATGRDPNHAVVAVTTGLLNLMDHTELEGVLAHELSHVGNFDIRLMAMVVILVSIVSILSNVFMNMAWFGGDREERDNGNGILMVVGIVAAILAPLVAAIVQLAISRRREYLADASGALLTRYPEGLASALAKIATSSQPLQNANTATAHLYLTSPFGNKSGAALVNLFSTHPPIEERIRRLQAMEGQV